MSNVRTFILLFLALATTKVAGFGSMHTEDERASRALTLPPSLDDAVNPKICNQAQPYAIDLLLAMGWMTETIAAQMSTPICSRHALYRTSCPAGYFQDFPVCYETCNGGWQHACDWNNIWCDKGRDAWHARSGVAGGACDNMATDALVKLADLVSVPTYGLCSPAR